MQSYMLRNKRYKNVHLKLIFYKNNLNPATDPKNLHGPALIFQANTHQNIGLDRANFLGL